LALLFFFFSSRRRHTRSKRDWSSDVCSSDLDTQEAIEETELAASSTIEESQEIVSEPEVVNNRENIEKTEPTTSSVDDQEIVSRSEERRVGKECRYRKRVNM